MKFFDELPLTFILSNVWMLLVLGDGCFLGCFSELLNTQFDWWFTLAHCMVVATSLYIPIRLKLRSWSTYDLRYGRRTLSNRCDEVATTE